MATTTAAARRTALARSLYRKLVRECDRIIPYSKKSSAVSLVHLNLHERFFRFEDPTTNTGTRTNTQFRARTTNSTRVAITAPELAAVYPTTTTTKTTEGGTKQHHHIINDRDTLKSRLRSSFAAAAEDDEEQEKERIRRALEGLRYSMALDISTLSSSSSSPTYAELTPTFSTTTTRRKEEDDNENDNDDYRKKRINTNNTKHNIYNHSSDSLLESVEWLPSLSDMVTYEDNNNNSNSNDKDQDGPAAARLSISSASSASEIILPVFPLSGPVFPATTQEEDESPSSLSSSSNNAAAAGNTTTKLPLLSQFSDPTGAVAGMEIPLSIFEPRYRQMYQDLLAPSTTTSDTEDGTEVFQKRFIVPFAHPYQPHVFAKYGWIYEITSVRDIGDESNGTYSLVCQHLVSLPVKIHSILNPHDYSPTSTNDKPSTKYLRARAELIRPNDLYVEFNQKKNGDHMYYDADDDGDIIANIGILDEDEDETTAAFTATDTDMDTSSTTTQPSLEDDELMERRLDQIEKKMERTFGDNNEDDRLETIIQNFPPSFDMTAEDDLSWMSEEMSLVEDSLQEMELDIEPVTDLLQLFQEQLYYNTNTNNSAASSLDHAPPQVHLCYSSSSSSSSNDSDDNNNPTNTTSKSSQSQSVVVDKSIIDRLLKATKVGSVWPVAQEYVSSLKSEIVLLQMMISNQIKMTAVGVAIANTAAAGDTSSSTAAAAWQNYVTVEMVQEAQRPYAEQLRCMLLEVATVIPWLLQAPSSHKEQCVKLTERLRTRLLIVNNKSNDKKEKTD